MAATLAEKGTAHAWETGARYHVLHAVALFGAAGWLRMANGRAARWIDWASRCWALGTIFFAGSLYGLALGGPRWLGPITPLGGVVLLAGWACVLGAATSKSDPP